jgi:hypothetical protein
MKIHLLRKEAKSKVIGQAVIWPCESRMICFYMNYMLQLEEAITLISK